MKKNPNLVISTDPKDTAVFSTSAINNEPYLETVSPEGTFRQNMTAISPASAEEQLFLNRLSSTRSADTERNKLYSPHRNPSPNQRFMPRPSILSKATETVQTIGEEKEMLPAVTSIVSELKSPGRELASDSENDSPERRERKLFSFPKFMGRSQSKKTSINLETASPAFKSDNETSPGENSPNGLVNRRRESTFSTSSLRHKNSSESLLKRLKTNAFASKIAASNISMTFDAFVDQKRGIEAPALQSDYPAYKIDKRLVFLGKEIVYPRFIVPYRSPFRRFWNLLILALICYQLVWHPMAASFFFGEDFPVGMVIFEFVTEVIFLFDIFLNMKTTYSNENNEEIIDKTMLKKHYMKSYLFYVDVISVIPIGEILLLSLIGSDQYKYTFYSMFKLIGLLRILKIPHYSERMALNTFFKIISMFGVFFLMTHWMSCIWYGVVLSYKPEEWETDVSKIWFPPTLRTLAVEPSELLDFYDNSVGNAYTFVLISIFMLMLGSDLWPVNAVQVCFTMIIGLMGAVILGYIFGSVTLLISQMNAQNSFYLSKLEQLRSKLAINKVPANLRVKVMEYFYYSWRKHKVLQKSTSFEELSIPLQRDLAFYQYKETIMKVPLFLELEPIEILSIIRRLSTSVYMPGDKIIREGERGSEMYFIREGKVEILIKKPVVQENGQITTKFDKIYLEKGSYFGEIALISSSKRTTDVNAYDFCILDTLSKADYNQLKVEFPDIGPRLKAGLKHYKNNHLEKIVQILKQIEYFEDFDNEELRIIVANYMEEIFLDPDRLVMKPKDYANSLYVILIGTVNCYSDKPETIAYLKQLKKNAEASQRQKAPIIYEQDEEIDVLDCVDDHILNMEKDQFSINDQKKGLDLITAFSFGQHFGGLDFETNDTKCKEFYITDSGCQIGVINKALLNKMEEDHPDLYDKLRINVIKLGANKLMSPIAEDLSETQIANRFKQDQDNEDKKTTHSASPRRRTRKELAEEKEWRQENKEEQHEMKARLTKVEDKIDKLMNVVQQLNSTIIRDSHFHIPNATLLSVEKARKDPHSRVNLAMSPNTKSLRFQSDSGEESPPRREDNGFFFEAYNKNRHRKKQSSINIQPIAEIEVTNIEIDENKAPDAKHEKSNENENKNENEKEKE